VDLVAQSPQGVVNLVIVQDQRWSGLESEWTSLNQKIHNYVAFVLDGQMAKQYPDVAGRGWRILIHNYFDDPPEEYLDALGKVGDGVRSHGGDLILEKLAPPSKPGQRPESRGAWRLGTGVEGRVPVDL